MALPVFALMSLLFWMYSNQTTAKKYNKTV